MDAKKNYINYCNENEVPLFFKPFWLDMIDSNWQVIKADIENTTLFFPFYIQKKWTFRFLRNAHLTPYGGFIFNQKLNTIDEETKSKLTALVLTQIPSFSLLNIDLHPTLKFKTNPFTDFISSQKKTNILHLSNKELCYQMFKPALQRQIKKAEKNLFIFEKDDIELFYVLHCKTFEKNNALPPTPFISFQNTWKICKQNECGKLLFIQDDQKNIHAALFLTYDSTSSYYLAGGTNPKYYGSGAMSLLMWHAIQLSFDMGKSRFDFEGSMLPTIDTFFKKFSPTEMEYTNLQKTNARLLKLLNKK
jgi:hypothetical protein